MLLGSLDGDLNSVTLPIFSPLAHQLRLITTMSDAITFCIPDTLRSWPWPRTINPHYAQCKRESVEWCGSFGALSPESQRALNLCDFNLLASLAFPLLNKDGCRIGCDLMNLFFVIRQHSDKADNTTVRTQMDVAMDALRGPHRPRPEDEWIGGAMIQSFWLNALRTATPSAQQRFTDAFQLYTDSVVQQTIDRNAHRIWDIQSYFRVRRDMIGAKPSFAINEVHLNLPEEVLEDEAIKELTAQSIDMLCIGNDLCSYNVEQSRGDDRYNLVTIVMHELDVDLHGALLWISNLHDCLVERFLTTWRSIPTYGGPLDLQVRTYVDGLANWVRANDQWNFESEIYFGKEGMMVERSREVVLLYPG